jgi:hypothetical protein
MASEFIPSDRSALLRLAELLHRFWSTEGDDVRLRLAAEVRHLEALFGLTPMDRRRLSWSIERNKAAETGDGAAAKAAAAPDPADDPRRALLAFPVPAKPS